MDSKETLNKIEKALTYYWCIGETLVDLSKCHISQETALKQIRSYIWVADDITYKKLDQIKKDLEVLEILKKKFVDLNRVKTYTDYRVYNCYQYSPKLYLTEKEFDKIKEWLEK